MRRSASRLAAGIAIVLAIAAGGVVLRGALPTDASTPPGSRGTGPAAVEPRGEFSLAALQSRKVPQGWSLIAKPERRVVRVFRRPKASATVRRLTGRRFSGRTLPQRFMVVGQRRGWVEVQMPGRPNLSTGWLRRRAVELQTTPYRIVVERKARRLILLRADRVLFNRPVAVGASLTPTPAGKYYVTDLIRSRDPFYGPYALGTSAHSNVYTTYAGGPGQLGIHGTNQPWSIGQEVSHGCIRVSNDVVRKLARLVPIGTPVAIR